VGESPVRAGAPGSPSATSARPTARSRSTRDTTTPVFSPFSGRVSKLIARPGDLVERGAPLFAIEASEFVQGHNDLVTAVAGVEKARSRLLLAQTAEKRQRDLQAIRGGALKDLEAGAVGPRGGAGRPAFGRDTRWPPCAPAAYPRPFGRGNRPARKGDRIGAETIVSAPIGGTIIQRRVGLGQYINAGANDPSSRWAISRRCG